MDALQEIKAELAKIPEAEREAWLDRQLQQAMKQKRAIQAVQAMSEEEVRDMILHLKL